MLLADWLMADFCPASPGFDISGALNDWRRCALLKKGWAIAAPIADVEYFSTYAVWNNNAGSPGIFRYTFASADAGTYTFEVTGYRQTGNAGYFQARMRVNGVEYRGGEATGTVTVPQTSTISRSVSAGDTVECWIAIEQTSTGVTNRYHITEADITTP